MAKDTYKKRAKGGWKVGKGCKGAGEERQFSKREIEQQLREDHADYLHRHRTRTPNRKAQLEYRIQWYILALGRYGRMQTDSFQSYLRDALQKAEAEYLKKYGGEK